MSDKSIPRKILFLAGLLVLLVVTGSTALVGPALATTSGLSVDSPTEPVQPDDSVSISANASTPGNDTTFAIDGDADGNISASEVIATVTADGTGAASTAVVPSNYGVGSVADGDFSVYSYEESDSDGTTSGPNGDGSSTSPGADYDESLSLTVDGSPPTATADTLPATASEVVDVTSWFTITNSDGGTTNYNYSTDGGASWTTIGSEAAFDTTGLPDGDVLFGANDTDDAGNYDTDSGSVTVDNTAPTVSITTPSEGDRVTSQDTIEGSSADTTGVSSVNLTIQRDSDTTYWNGTGWQATRANVSTSAADGAFDESSEDWSYDSAGISADDSYTVFANATDSVGHTNGSATVSYTLYTESSSPTPSSSGDSSSTVEETVDISDVTVARQESRTPTVDEAEGTSTVTFSEGSEVESISFESTSVGGSVTSRTLSEEPAATGSAPGTTVSVVSITVPDGAADTSATIRTRVSAARLDAVGGDPTALGVTRYNDDVGEWQPLPTVLVSQSDNGVVLEAETPGFSIFAVSIEPTDEETVDDATADAGPTEQTGETASNTVGADESAATTTGDTAGTTEGFAPGFGVVAALVALLAVAAFPRRSQ